MKETRKNRTGKKRQESRGVCLTRMQRLLIKGLQEGKSLLQAALAANTLKKSDMEKTREWPVEQRTSAGMRVSRVKPKKFQIFPLTESQNDA